MYPFCLQGNKIEIFRYKLNYSDYSVEGEEQVFYSTNLETAENEKAHNPYAAEGTIQELDVSSAEWIDGLIVESAEEAERIWDLGQVKYQAAQNSSTIDEFLLDLDYRTSLLELGVS